MWSPTNSLVALYFQPLSERVFGCLQIQKRVERRISYPKLPLLLTQPVWFSQHLCITMHPSISKVPCRKEANSGTHSFKFLLLSIWKREMNEENP